MRLFLRMRLPFPPPPHMEVVVLTGDVLKGLVGEHVNDGTDHGSPVGRYLAQQRLQPACR